MGIDYIRDHIEEDINSIKSTYNEDVSLDIVTFLNGFVSHYNHHSPSTDLFKDIFLYDMKGLEKSLEKKIEKPVSLHETLKAGYEICRILQQDKNTQELGELVNYLSKLITR